MDLKRWEDMATYTRGVVVEIEKASAGINAATRIQADTIVVGDDFVPFLSFLWCQGDFV